VYALEYLTDSELEKLDGYTSKTLVKEYDEEGNLVFKRQDTYPCRFNQSEADSDARQPCETILESEQERLMAENFDRYLRAALPFFGEPEDFDDPTDGISFTTLTGLANGESFETQFCDGEDHPGVIRVEGLTIQDENGGELVIGPIEGRLEREVINGRERSVIVSRTPDINGLIGFEAIRIGRTSESARNAASLGALYTTSIGGSELRIYRSDN